MASTFRSRPSPCPDRAVAGVFVFTVVAALSACAAYDPKFLHRDAASDSASSDASHNDASDNDTGVVGCIPSDQEFCPEICPETCNTLDDDCDTTIDEDNGDPLCTLTDARTACVSGACLVIGCINGASDCDGLPGNGCEARLDSPQHCGFCYAACNIPNATVRCELLTSGPTCVFDQCVPGFANCDGDDSNGCELRADSLDNCGDCGVMCGAVANGQPGCIDGVCGVADCDTGFDNCDADPENGCEASLDTLTDCGKCDTICAYDHAVALCAGQSCVPGSCIDGFGDCDSDPRNECEARLTADVNNCGSCGRDCTSLGGGGSAYQCVNGDCVVTTCPLGFADCDSDANNGCETSLQTLTDCGGCDVPCDYDHASASCATGSCTFTSCEPGFGDCNTDLIDGCETALNTDANCGACASVCGASDSRTCSGGVCSLAPCPSGSADCDGDGTTCEQSLSALAHCGACNARCGDTNGQLPNATASCSTASCAVGTCNANFANCDGAAQNGCETSLRTTASCGACGTACSRPNASVSCATGSCANTACNTGFGDCDGNASNGCETSTDTTSDCGACNNDCARPNAVMACTSGACTRVACNPGFGDCDGIAQNGCETALNSLTHCGACNTACALTNATESCSTGTCSLVSCAMGFGNCDFSASNGCEAPLNTTGNCTACGTLCDYANSTETCTTGTCTLNGCNSGYGNCDTNEPNGCEQALNTTSHCGNCNAACATNERCNAGVCARGFPYTPTNFDAGDVAITPAAAATFNCGVSIFNSTTLAFTNWCGQPMPTPVVRTQSAGPDVVILAFDAITVATGATVQLIGTRPVILASYGNATITGTLDANATGATPGAGGDWSCGSSRGTNGTFQTSEGRGGGGGGFRGIGGNGGRYSSSSAGGPGGVARGVAILQPLIGGCGGGNGGGCTNGASGGGALQLSVSGTLSITGTIRANGGTGINECGGQTAGGGGGSGGAILLEANALTVTGTMVTARGGNGGNGNGGNGGAGSQSGASPNGSDGATSNDGAGGGGGAHGRIHLRGVMTCSHALPSVSVGGVCL